MSEGRKQFYCALGPPKTQPRTLDFETERKWKVSGRKGRGEIWHANSLENLSLNSQESLYDDTLKTETSSPKEYTSGNN